MEGTWRRRGLLRALGVTALMVRRTQGGRLFVGYLERDGPNQALFPVAFSRSLDGGLTWSSPVKVNDDTSGRDQWMPALGVDGSDNLHLAWMDNRTGNYNVFYSTSKDGRRWSKNLKVTDAETPGTMVRPGDYMGLTVDSLGTVFLAWTDGRSGNYDIYFARKPGSPPP